MYKVVPDGKGGSTADKIAVQIDFENLGRVALMDRNLNEGDRVVVEGNERLIPGSPIQIAETSETGADRVREASHPDESRSQSSIR